MRKTLYAIAAATVLTATAWTGITSASDNGDAAHASTAEPANVYTSGYCLDDTGDGGEGTVQQLWACHNVIQEWWQFAGFSHGTGLINKNGLCLDATGGGTVNGGTVQVWNCIGDNAQLWRQISNSDGSISFVNGGAQKCLDFVGGRIADGTKFQVWTCNGLASQKFLWAYTGGGFSQLTPIEQGNPAIQNTGAQPPAVRVVN